MAVQTKMTADEFLQLPESLTLTELIDGQIIMAPAPETGHQITAARGYDILTNGASHNENSAMLSLKASSGCKCQKR